MRRWTSSFNSPEYHEGIRIIRPQAHDGIRAMIDPDQMKQVFWNLLINAAQSMSQGGDLRLQLEKGGEGLLADTSPPALPAEDKGMGQDFDFRLGMRDC